MLITIITPSRNQGKYIKDCLDSVHGQSHIEIEHLIFDGMSTDETAMIASNYPAQFFQQKDTGPAQAINRGLEAADGDIVCWLNADDCFFGNDTLRTVVRIFEEHPTVDVVTGDGYYIEDDGTLLQPIVPVHPGRMTAKWMRRSDPFLQPATFWRRNKLRLDEDLHYTFDWKLWIDFFNERLNVLYVSQYLALYRVHPASLTRQDPSLRRMEIFRIIKRYGDNSVQSAWCWLVWKLVRVDEKISVNFFRPITRMVNRILDRMTAGLVTWG